MKKIKRLLDLGKLKCYTIYSWELLDNTINFTWYTGNKSLTRKIEIKDNYEDMKKYLLLRKLRYQDRIHKTIPTKRAWDVKNDAISGLWVYDVYNKLILFLIKNKLLENIKLEQHVFDDEVTFVLDNEHIGCFTLESDTGIAIVTNDYTCIFTNKENVEWKIKEP